MSFSDLKKVPLYRRRLGLRQQCLRLGTQAALAIELAEPLPTLERGGLSPIDMPGSGGSGHQTRVGLWNSLGLSIMVSFLRSKFPEGAKAIRGRWMNEKAEDPELKAMATLLSVLEPLSEEARLNVID